MRYRMLGDRQVSALCLGTLPFGTTVDEATSFALLDRFVERGGTFLDTANCYCFWVDGSRGDDSEALLGRWLAERGAHDEIAVATKLGALPDPARGAEWPANRQGLGAEVVARAARESRERLGVERIDLLYGHVDDPATPVEETVAAFGALVKEGIAAQVGISNQSTPRVVRSRQVAAETGSAPYAAVQQRHTYLMPAPDADFDYQVHADQELLDYASSRPELTVLAYGPLVNGAYTDPDKELQAQYRHAGTERQLDALRAVAEEAGATANQVALAWLMGGSPSVLPVIGVSGLAQLDEALDAVELNLTTEQRERLDQARRWNEISDTVV
ncbi:aldo/keto reductase [Streptacidiphilus pinicola]|uniref:Aldo/keto reductase n=1 Tax=Streptacidiphilus pinicola TaxID=2219663 RepID=A0A2X0IBA5_9ACTN|nr:aldo/keto reductase [Streptacidiphilus pinicola]RAG80923.1 aldo/keto reductase [Streptacidiphilus pinicola]